MYNHNSNIIQFGWKCPECGAIMAPWQNTCVNCTGKNQSPIEYHTATPNITIKPDEITNVPNISWNTITCNSNTPDVTLTSHNKLSEILKINHITTWL